MKTNVRYGYDILVLVLFISMMGSSYSNVTAQTIQKVDSAGIQKLPSIPFLPDPLVLDEGGKNIPVETKVQWKQKRKRIKKQYQYWISGSVPPPPESFQVNIRSNTTKDDVEFRTVELFFGPGNKAKMTVELMIPADIKGTLPVFMTQWNHRGWAQVAVRRGYMGVVYAGADAKDDTKNYKDLYLDYDFAKLMRRAWGASRVVDYLYTLSEVDTTRIALTGHSRNGKQSLMAAAFDKRIDAVVSSSGGTGGENTFRYSDYRFTPGSFDRMVKIHNWFSPRLNWFIGREQKLPVDQNLLMSLIAPRGLMMVSAINEAEGNPWGIEQSYRSVKRVYHFLKADSSVAIRLRRGRHQHAARDIEQFIDFFDYIFERSSKAPKNNLYYGYSFKEWKQLTGKQINPLEFPVASNNQPLRFTDTSAVSFQQDSIRREISWLLGDTPPGVSPIGTFSPMLGRNATYKNDYLSEVIGEPDLPDGTTSMKFGPYLSLGDNLWGTMYFPPDAVQVDSVAKKLPLVIYLHKYSYAGGYRTRQASSIIGKFTQQGYAVLMFDLIGFGTRIQEAKDFYDRYPNWSKMGKMVTDVRNVISDACRRMSFIDAKNIYLTGYSLGGTVALFTAALDTRVKGTAVVSAINSLRKSENIQYYSRLTGLMPRLGPFIGHGNRIPVDFKDILASIAPRSVMLIAPELYRSQGIEAVKNTTQITSNVYNSMHVSNKLTFKYPNTYNHFTKAMQQQIAKWLLRQK